MNKIEIFLILINSFYFKKPNKEIAEIFNCHRNTVSKYVNRFIYLKKEITSFFESINETSSISTWDELMDLDEAKCIMSKINKPDKRNCPQSTHNGIEKYCKKYLNYYIALNDIKKFAEKMVEIHAERLSLDFHFDKNKIRDHIVNYKAYKFSTYSYRDFGFYSRDSCREYMRRITEIRRYNKVPKNYEEVYYKYCESDYYKQKPISYSTFYGIARKYWGEEEIDYILINAIHGRRLRRKKRIMNNIKDDTAILLAISSFTCND